MKFTKIKYLFVFISIIASFLLIIGVEAQLKWDPKDNLGWGSITKLNISDTNDPIGIAIGIINWALVFLGIISTGLILYAGIVWFFAGAEEEKVTKAKDIIKGAIIGLVIVLSAYSLTNFIYYRIYYSTVNLDADTPMDVIEGD